MILILYYLVLCPVGLVLKLAGIDLLRRKLSGRADSYWEEA
jgi:hypothetical protein